MKIGYCPTMEEFVKSIKNIQDFEIYNLEAAGRALYHLNNDDIDIAIIGRKAKKVEFDGYEKAVGNGYTLITYTKGMIPKEQLPNIEVHTHIAKEIVEKYFAELKNVVYHNTLQEALDQGDVQLISWDDWDDRFELLIPVDEYYNKVKKYRVPRFYSKKDILESIKY